MFRAKKIRWVNGWKIRNTLETDFNGWGENDSYPFIPKGDVWIEQYMKPELPLILELSRLEKRIKGKGFRLIRAAAAQELTRPTSLVFGLRRERKGKLWVVWVDGATVRQTHDPYFVSGGHDLVYTYIPRNEIWIDVLAGKKEGKYTLIHELYERQLMSRGMKYDDAHDFALAEERRQRREDGVAHFIRG